MTFTAMIACVGSLSVIGGVVASLLLGVLIAEALPWQ